MALNPDGAKEEQEVILSKKTNKSTYSPFYFNNTAVELTHHRSTLAFS